MRSIAPILCNLTEMLTSPAALRCYGERPAAARLISSGYWVMFTANHCASSTVRPAPAPRSSLPRTETSGLAGGIRDAPTNLADLTDG